MFLQTPDNTPPVLDATVRAQSIPLAGVTWSAGEGAGESLSQQWKAHVVHLRLLLRLTDRNTAPVDCNFRPMHATEVCRH